MTQEVRKQPRDIEEYDVVIVGGGPAGLATAIRLKQLELENGKEIKVCLLDKGSEVGSHILSGNCFETEGFSKLFPGWEELPEGERPPINQKVIKDTFKILFGKNSSLAVPEVLLPPQIHNGKNYIISLGRLCNWMGEKAQELGVDLFSGFAADQLVYDESGKFVKGVATTDTGIDKNWQPKSTFQRGMELHAKQVVLAEGARGSLSERAIKEFNLRRDSDEQTYGIGLKEVWEVPEDKLVPGLVEHTVGFPLSQDVYGGSFMYHEAPNRIHLGFVVGLDYKNPYLNPYLEFQKLKTHPEISKYLKEGTCVKYGARALNEGGFFSIPKLTFPGGLLIGCSAGLLNVAKIKGANAAIVSGTTAAEAIYYSIHFGENKPGVEVTEYVTNLKKTNVWQELYKTRKFHGGFKYGLYGGLAHGFMITFLTRGSEFWNLRTHGKDTTKTLPANKCTVKGTHPAH